MMHAIQTFSRPSETTGAPPSVVAVPVQHADDPAALLAYARRLDVRLWLDAQGQLRYSAPKGVMSDELRARLALNRQGVIEAIEDEPIVIPHDWRSTLGTWPIDRWIHWRRRSGEIQAEAGGPVTVEVIEAADRRAFDEMARPQPAAEL